jgi:CRP-like cAMP-binding protein
MQEGAIHDVLLYCADTALHQGLQECLNDDFLLRLVDNEARLEPALADYAPDLLILHAPTQEQLDFLCDLGRKLRLPAAILLTNPELIRQPARVQQLLELELGQYISLPIEPRELGERLENYFASHRLSTVAQTYKRRYSPGEPIFLENEMGHESYAIISGRVRICKVIDRFTVKEIAQLGPGEFFGEMALLTTEPRSSTALAIDDVVVTVTTQETFCRVADSDPYFVANLVRVLSDRIRSVEQLIPEFSAGEPPVAAEPVLHGFDKGKGCRFFPAGQVLYEVGEPASCFYLLESGRVELFRPPRAYLPKTDRAIVEPPALLGDVAFVLKRSFTRRATAVEDTMCRVLSSDSLTDELRTFPALYLRMAQGLTSALRARLERLASAQMREVC